MIYRKALLGSSVKKDIIKFTSSSEEDVYLIDEVIKAFMAHAKALVRAHIVSKEELLNRLINYLRSDDAKRRLRDMLRSNSYEDVFEALEDLLSEVIGKEYSYFILGRSRNDQVAAVLRMKTLNYVREVLTVIKEIRSVLKKRACEYLEVPLPLHTHLQPAQLSTVAHYLLYIDELLAVHESVIKFITDNVVSCSPLGSSAIAGTIVCIDRVGEGIDAGFNSICSNTLYATSTRDFISLTLSVITSLITELTRVFNDLIIWNNAYISIVSIPNEHLATSSVMPHKKNPVTLEVMRAASSEIESYLNAVLGIIRNTTSGYNLDLQEINKYLIKSLELTISVLRVFKDLISNLKFNEERIRKLIREHYTLVITDVAEVISIKCGIPYRSVHSLIGSLIRSCGDSMECLINKLCGELLKRKCAICNLIKEILDNPERVLKYRCVLGSPNPEVLREVCRQS